ncbi:hypothetical protein GC089_00355 [Cellulomonas sp. JZ18]|uniref:hypothetical protein n=1 Tax=Cellulomonas sp. JZ18 TaxID=2654191 RepID=UPI0012D4858F|nr:hypothetical protein [Cellulomonas sp. JZ18]QGQ17996.1 hypothetical protein GC089_00355 [Cellulomonas sp. JZ18]
MTDRAVGTPDAPATPWTPVLAAVLGGALVGLALVVAMSRLSSQFGYFYAPDASAYVGAFVLPVVCAVLSLLARAGSLAWLFSARKRPLAFGRALGLAGIPFTLSTPVLVLVLLLSLVPGTFTAFVLLLAGAFTAFYAEITTYIAVARVGRFESSPVLLHSVLSAAWLAVVALVAALVLNDATSTALGGFGMLR